MNVKRPYRNSFLKIFRGVDVDFTDGSVTETENSGETLFVTLDHTASVLFLFSSSDLSNSEDK